MTQFETDGAPGVIPLSHEMARTAAPRTDLTMLTPQLQTERLIFRQPCASDLVPYTHYCLSERTRYVGGPFTEVQAFEKLASMIGHWELRGFGRFVFVEQETGRAIGHFGALQYDTTHPPEITWTIWNSDDEGKGYATEAGRALKNHARQELGFRSMIACVHHDNSASRGLAERLGGILNVRTAPPKWLPASVIYDFILAA